MKKRYPLLLILGWVLVHPFNTYAQIDNDDEEATTLPTTNDEEALPEGMQQQEIDSLIKDWTTRNFLSFDDNCQTTGENPVFEPEVYANKLHRLPNVVDMPYNDIVRQYIDTYSGRLRRTVSIMLGAGNFYNPIFEEALESYQVPLELKYLPIIESALNPGATSRAGAAGLWQFMITTGKRYGLEVTSLIDERRDPVKASYAAAHHLKDLYNIFGDWTLAIAAYNCGPGNVSKAIKRAGGIKDFWTLYPYLPAETRNYVPAFIAANYIMNYYCDHNICPVNTTLPQATDTLMLKRNVKMENIVKMCGVDMAEVKALNPQYRTTLIPGDSHDCILRLRTEHINAFLEAGDSIYIPQTETIQVSETPVVTETPITTSYEKSSRHEKSSKSSRSNSSRKKGRGSSSVSIKSGDTLGEIARRNHTTVAKLKKLNHIKGDNIRAGEKLSNG